jgi:2-polyprenyl-3-methyl-5-hydroxy-6-metoxy-1,4-benzoquinol methylase|tara:strand:- start:37 stop:750 length:714 start_codon:yes stop_codon:yes gene_type:complete
MKNVIVEPPTYTRLYKALKKSKNSYYKVLNEDKIDSHSQVYEAHYFAHRLYNYIKFFFKLSKARVLDCGSGLGYIARELDKVKEFDVYAADPSVSVKKISEQLFLDKKFIHCEINTIPRKYNNFFDIIYLREVYPFTRKDNLQLHKKLLSTLFKKIKKNGILILEQIKNEKDIFNNLDDLKIDYKIHYLLPVKLNRLDFMNIYLSKLKIMQFFIFIMYKIFQKKINQFIIIKKVADL